MYTRETRELRQGRKRDPRHTERRGFSDRQELGEIRDGKAWTLGSATEAAAKAEMKAWKHTHGHTHVEMCIVCLVLPCAPSLLSNPRSTKASEGTSPRFPCSNGQDPQKSQQKR